MSDEFLRTCAMMVTRVWSNMTIRFRLALMLLVGGIACLAFLLILASRRDELTKLRSDVLARFGRRRQERWGPRTIDIDILDYDHREIRTERLILPHPGIAVRAFVARPLLDISPDFQLKDGTNLRDHLDKEPLVSQQITRTGSW